MGCEKINWSEIAPVRTFVVLKETRPKEVKLVTEWAEFKKREQSCEATLRHADALEEITKMRAWLQAIPMNTLMVGDYQLITAWFVELDKLEMRVKAFMTYNRAFPEGK